MTDYCEVCNDDRNAMVAKYFEKLKDATNIETSQEEMQVIENILFRFWQLGWLHKIDAAGVRPVARGRWEEVTVDMIEDLEFPPTSVAAMFCPNCKRWHNEVYFYGNPTEFANYCPNCGAKMVTDCHQLDEEDKA